LIDAADGYGFAALGLSVAPADAAVSAVARALLGGASRYGQYPAYSVTGAQSLLGLKLASASASANAFTHGYASEGMLGVYVSAMAGELGASVTSVAQAVAQIARGDVSAEALTRAKVAAKLALAARGESALGLAQLVAEQTLLGQKVDAAAIDKVSKDDLVRVVKAAVAKNPAFVVVGEVENVPYADELAALLRA